MRKHGKIIIKLHSDICIHSGYAYRGTIDSDVCCDQYGIPFLPARRLKGCLREAAFMIRLHPDLQGVNLDDLFGERGQFRYEKAEKNGNNARLLGNIIIENARIPNYAQICGDLESLHDTPLAPYLGKQDVLEQYSSVRAQTSMVSTCEELFRKTSGDHQESQAHIGVGCAKDNTLRSIRVINSVKRKPVAGEDSTNTCVEPVQFEADIYYTDDSDNDSDDRSKEITPVEKALAAIAKAVRHLGLSRTRGLGSVSCSFIPDQGTCSDEHTYKVNQLNQEDVSPAQAIQKDGCRDYALFYSLCNIEPLMLSQGNDVRTESFIPARNMIGALAWEYLSINGNNDQSEEFKNLFLNGTVHYTNMYIMDNDTRCIPAPGFINELKKNRLLINTLYIDESSNDECKKGKTEKNNDTDYGNQPKKLKGKYLCINKEGIKKKEVKTEIIYHNRNNGSEEEQGIYTQEVISAGQTFGGYIYVDPQKNIDDHTACEMLNTVNDLLTRANLRFGKSRTAQYGRCKLLKGMPKRVPLYDPSVERDGADHIVVSLASDGLFCKKGVYTTCFEDVYRIIAEDTGISEYVDLDIIQDFPDLPENARKMSICDSGLVWGYNSKWNLRIQPSPAILAGSAFVYKIRPNDTCDVHFPVISQVGTRRTEGYGEVRILYMSKEKFPYDLSTIKEKASDKDDSCAGIDSLNEVSEKEDNNSDAGENVNQLKEVWKNLQSEEGRKIVQSSVLQHMSEEMRRNILRSVSTSGKLHLSNSTTGRVTLMLKESREAIGPANTEISALEIAELQFKDFAGRSDKNHPSRIRSIKRKKERREMERIIRNYFVRPENMKPDKEWKLDAEYMMEKLLPGDGCQDIHTAIETVFSEDERKSLQASLWTEMMETLLTGNKYSNERKEMEGE